MAEAGFRPLGVLGTERDSVDQLPDGRLHAWPPHMQHLPLPCHLIGALVVKLLYFVSIDKRDVVCFKIQVVDVTSIEAQSK